MFDGQQVISKGKDLQEVLCCGYVIWWGSIYSLEFVVVFGVIVDVCVLFWDDFGVVVMGQELCFFYCNFNFEFLDYWVIVEVFWYGCLQVVVDVNDVLNVLL